MATTATGTDPTGGWRVESGTLVAPGMTLSSHIDGPCAGQTLAGIQFLKDFDEKNFAESTLEGCDLSGLRLWDATFRDATLVGCKLDETDMHRVNLAGTTFESCEFAGWEPWMGDLTGAAFRNCGFSRCAFAPAFTDGAAVVFGGCWFRGSSFRDCDLPGARFEGSTFIETAFSPGTNLTGALFEDCEFADWPRSPGHNGRFGCQKTDGATFRRTKFGYLDFAGADLTGAVFESCEFGGHIQAEGADFSGADIPGRDRKRLRKLGAVG